MASARGLEINKSIGWSGGRTVDEHEVAQHCDRRVAARVRW
jgi:hypothetical protein